MGTLICKSCNGKEFYKIPGFYVCKSCGRKYSELEASAIERRVVVKKPNEKKENDHRLTVKGPNIKPVIKPIGLIKPKEPPKPKREIKRIVKTKNIALPKLDTQNTIGNEVSIKDAINDTNVIESLLVFAYDSYKNKDYIKAEEYANRIIELDPKNIDAWLIKGNSAIDKSTNSIFRLEDSIKYWYNAIMYSSPEEVMDLKYSINTKLIKIASDYISLELKGFSINPKDSYLELLDKNIDYLSPIIKKGVSLLGLDEGLYYETLADKLIDIADRAYNKISDEFNVEDFRKTDSLYEDFKNKADGCIKILERVLKLPMQAKTMNKLITTLIRLHRGIVNACSYKLSGHKLKLSLSSSEAEKEERISRIKDYEEYIEKSFLSAEDLNLDIKNPLTEVGSLNKKVRELEKEISTMPERIELNELIDKQASSSLVPLKRVVQEKTNSIEKEIDSYNRRILAISIRYNLNKL